jgi:hypothetical protein
MVRKWRVVLEDLTNAGEIIDEKSITHRSIE